MDVDIRVDIDEDGPVVVKSARGRAVERLQHEHHRLSRAVHPGVVALARHQPHPAPPDPPAPREAAASHSAATGAATDDAHDPDQVDDTESYALYIRYAGEPVTRWTGTITGIAGLGAAVAGTLADLHGIGIVHGRIDGSHILIGDDSRPRLCGLGHSGDAQPADDVAALGAVLGDLLERAPAGRLRRPRGSGSASRALRHVVERAADPVPTRRPSAGALADAIVDAVPGADLPAPLGSAGPVATGGGGRLGRPDDDAPRAAPAACDAAARQDTLDRIWSYAGEQSDDERWAAAFGSGPRDLPAGGVSPRAPTRTSAPAQPHRDLPLEVEAPPPLPMARLDTPGWSRADDGPTSPGKGNRPFRVRSRDDRDSTPPVDHRAHDSQRRTAGHLDRFRGTAADPWDRHPVRHDDDRHDHRSDDHGDSGWGDDDDLLTHDNHHSDDHTDSGWDDDDVLLTRDHRVPVPRAVRAPADDATRPERARRIVVIAALAIATCLATAGAFMVSAQGGDGGDPRSDTEGVAAPADCPSAAAPVADVDGDGCPEGLVVDGSTIDAGVARWTLGEPGDLVTVGDWDCDGDASAALLRPTTGDVFVFTAWAPSDEPVTVSASQQVAGGIGIRAQPADGAGCDQLLVDRADGTAATVEVAR